MQIYQALITLDGWTFLAQICNLFIQLMLFKKLLLNPVHKILAERKAKADSEIANAEQLRAEAAAMKAEYEQDMAAARERANQIVATAQKTATARTEEMLGEDFYRWLYTAFTRATGQLYLVNLPKAFETD